MSKTVDSSLVVYLITWNTEECQAVDYSHLSQAYLARSKVVGRYSIIITTTTTRNSLTIGNRKLRPRTLASRRGGDNVLAPLRRILGQGRRTKADLHPGKVVFGGVGTIVSGEADALGNLHEPGHGQPSRYDNMAPIPWPDCLNA
jgi:hypothetical protein